MKVDTTPGTKWQGEHLMVHLEAGESYYGSSMTGTVCIPARLTIAVPGWSPNANFGRNSAFHVEFRHQGKMSPKVVRAAIVRAGEMEDRWAERNQLVREVRELDQVAASITQLASDRVQHTRQMVIECAELDADVETAAREYRAALAAKEAANKRAAELRAKSEAAKATIEEIQGRPYQA